MRTRETGRMGWIAHMARSAQYAPAVDKPPSAPPGKTMSLLKQTRREYLASVGVVGSASLTGCTASENIPSEFSNLDPRATGNQSGTGPSPTPLKQTFDFDSRFDSVEWINLGNILEVTFEEDHGMDAFALAHSYRTDEGQWMGAWEAPEFSGPVDINFKEELSRYADSYPTRNFTLIGYNGSGSMVIYVTERLSSVEFTMPKSVAPPEYFEDIETTTADV